jgi:hypothetical protein
MSYTLENDHYWFIDRHEECGTTNYFCNARNQAGHKSLP